MSNQKSIIFFGTPEFAVSSLKALLENNFLIKAVVTTPDKPSGRGKKITFSPLKVYALEKGLTILQPENLSELSFNEELNRLNADLFIVVAFRKLPAIVWQLPRLGTFNLHASLLPDYRGAAPINWAIINGETETGVTTFFLNENIDEGKIILSQKVNIEKNETFGDLYNRLKNAGAELLIKTAQLIFDNQLNIIDQSEIVKNYSIIHKAPKIVKSDCRINWNDKSVNIINKIRGLSPTPAAFTILKDSEENELYLKIFSAGIELSNHTFNTGTLVTDNKTHLKIATIDGFILLEEIQAAGKNKMKINDFLRGNQININFTA